MCVGEFWMHIFAPSTAWPQRNPTSWQLNRLSGPVHSHAANSCFQHHAPYLGDVPDWCCLHLPQLRSWREEWIWGESSPPITAVQYLSLRQLHVHSPAWWAKFGYRCRACWHCGTASLFRMKLWDSCDWGDKSVPRWVLCSLWSFVPSGLAGSKSLVGLIWLCAREKHTISFWPG